jgi:hypothetical protein
MSRLPSTQFQDVEQNSRLAWSVNSFCRAIGISRTKFYQLKKTNQIRTISIGRRRLVPDSEVKRLASNGSEFEAAPCRSSASREPVAS